MSVLTDLIYGGSNAVAGLTEGVITTGTTIQCTGTFRKYEDTGYAPKCWIASSGTTHGNDNVTEAIRDSCNIFFYTVGDSLPIDTLARCVARNIEAYLKK